MRRDSYSASRSAASAPVVPASADSTCASACAASAAAFSAPASATSTATSAARRSAAAAARRASSCAVSSRATGWPATTRVLKSASSSRIWPESWLPTETVTSGLTVPVAETAAVMAPRSTAAVRGRGPPASAAPPGQGRLSAEATGAPNQNSPAPRPASRRRVARTRRMASRI